MKGQVTISVVETEEGVGLAANVNLEHADPYGRYAIVQCLMEAFGLDAKKYYVLDLMFGQTHREGLERFVGNTAEEALAKIKDGTMRSAMASTLGATPVKGNREDLN